MKEYQLIEIIEKTNDLTGQIAFAFNENTWNLLLSNSGHGKITRDKDKRDFVGGWIFLNDEKISFNTGSLANPDSDQQQMIENAISGHFSKPFRIVNK